MANNIAYRLVDTLTFRTGLWYHTARSHISSDLKINAYSLHERPLQYFLCMSRIHVWFESRSEYYITSDCDMPVGMLYVPLLCYIIIHFAIIRCIRVEFELCISTFWRSMSLHSRDRRLCRTTFYYHSLECFLDVNYISERRRNEGLW